MDLPKQLIEHAPWKSLGSSIWLASAFELMRNFHRYKFPGKMDATEKQSLDLLQKNVMMNARGLEQPVLLAGSQLSPLSKEFLLEHFLFLEGLSSSQENLSLIVDATGEVLLLLNDNDHIKLRFFDSSGKWENGFAKLCEIEESIGKEIGYAFSQKFGYLTSNPLLCGTGLKGYVYLHLPALIHMNQLTNALTKEKEEGIFATSMMGEIDKVVGDIIVLENYYTLGITEESILRGLHIMAMKLIGAEKTLRQHIKEKKSPEIMDHVARSFGLLRHSFQLGVKETWDALSFLRLGIDLGWISGVSEMKANELFFKIRRAHLAYELKETQHDQAEIAQKRAHFLHQELANMKLLIES